MKKLFIISAIALSGLVYNTANAQIRFHVGFRFRPRVVVYTPAPVVVEQAPVYEQPAAVVDQDQPAYSDNSDDYYYLPDVDAYYDVTDQCYYYNDGNNWISAAYLPGAYRNYDWRNAPRYEVRASRPYLHDDVYRSKYNGHVNNQWAQNNYNNHSNNGQRGFSQPAQPYKNQNGNTQHFDNRGQGNSAQPFRRDENRNKDTRGGSEHFVQNSPQGGFANHRMTKS
jgi:hypothetical protein